MLAVFNRSFMSIWVPLSVCYTFCRTTVLLFNSHEKILKKRLDVRMRWVIYTAPHGTIQQMPEELEQNYSSREVFKHLHWFFVIVRVSCVCDNT